MRRPTLFSYEGRELRVLRSTDEGRYHLLLTDIAKVCGLATSNVREWANVVPQYKLACVGVRGLRWVWCATFEDAIKFLTIKAKYPGFVAYLQHLDQFLHSPTPTLPSPETIQSTPSHLPTIRSLVHHSIEERAAASEAKFGTPLRAYNGRCALKDAKRELIDALFYVEQAAFERDNTATLAAQARQQAEHLTELLSHAAFEVTADLLSWLALAEAELGSEELCDRLQMPVEALHNLYAQEEVQTNRGQKDDFLTPRVFLSYAHYCAIQRNFPTIDNELRLTDRVSFNNQRPFERGVVP